MKEFVEKWSVFRERWTLKNQVTSVLCSTLYSSYWRNLYRVRFSKVLWNLKAAYYLYGAYFRWSLYIYERPYLCPSYIANPNLIQHLLMYFWRENSNSVFDTFTRNWLKRLIFSQIYRAKVKKSHKNIITLNLLQNESLEIIFRH